MTGPLAIGVDVGGTKVAALLVDSDGGVLDRRLVPSPADNAEAVTRTVVALVAELLSDHDGVVAVGVGAAGLVSRDGVVRFAPNVAWREFPLRERVAAGVRVPVAVENDANVAAWGEFRFGAGRGTADLLVVTVGTGIGGGIVIGGELFRGANGLGAEIGHIIVEPHGPLCGCGNHGCWEQMASGRAIERLGRIAAAEQRGSVLAEIAGGDPSRLTGPDVTKAARDGDPVASGILEEVGRRLGQGIAGLVNVLDPEAVVVGGGAAEARDLLLKPARRAYAESVEAPSHRPEVPILGAELGNDAGAIGAADLARRQVAG
jgi:glucokinase